MSFEISFKGSHISDQECGNSKEKGQHAEKHKRQSEADVMECMNAVKMTRIEGMHWGVNGGREQPNYNQCIAELKAYQKKLEQSGCWQLSGL